LFSRFFKLPVQHGAEAEWFGLGKDELMKFRAKWKDVKLIIVDEVSMVSNVTLLKMHRRLNEVLSFDKDESFGGKNVLLLGDLLQLPPVKADFCFEPITSKATKDVFGTVGTYSLWNEFVYKELEINMRQRDDSVWSEMLNRIRLGIPTEKDVTDLQTCFISKDKKRITIEEAAKFYAANLMISGNCVCLLPKVETVDLFNDAMLKIKNVTIVEILASDINLTRKNAKSASKQRKKPVKLNQKQQDKVKKAADTAGLEEILRIGIEARVMLRRNISTQSGLVNGALGTVRAINTNERGVVTEIVVEFDTSKESVPIKRVKAEFFVSRGIKVERQQFPLCLAYAITIHKSQGMTLDKVLLDVGSTVFEPGMIYVALSRVRKLQDVYFIDFDPTKITCKQIAADEYNRLRIANNYSPIPLFNKLPPSLYQEKMKQILANNSRRQVDGGMILLKYFHVIILTTNFIFVFL
jgi:PIF1-like helicase/Helicase